LNVDFSGFSRRSERHKEIIFYTTLADVTIHL
jgi:hypothetical protein